MKSVVDSCNNCIGYVINDYFYDNYYIDFTNKVDIESVYGIYTKSGILTEDGLYKSASSVLNVSNYFDLLSNLGVPLSSIIFIPCEFSDLDTENMSSIWGSFINCYLYVCIDGKTLKEVAYLMLRQDLFSYCSIHINMLECIEKGKGYGTYIVKQLKCLDKEITGLATYTAQHFWEQQGAIFKGSNLHFSI